jgi:hypothetical protein
MNFYNKIMEEKKMSRQIKGKRRILGGLYGLVVLFAVALIFFGSYQKADAQQKTFKTPEEAAKSLMDALRSNNTKELLAIFGTAGKEIISSGDEVADKTGRERFVKDYEEMNKLEKETDKKVTLVVGKNEWPFAIPIVKKGETWVFDTKAGKEEMLNRRIGRNELNTIQTCLAMVDAQREYAMKDRDGDKLLEYAQKFASTKGKKDGLYWEAKEGEEQSPLGALAARAVQEGYAGRKPGDNPLPYHGYFYRILKAQGKNAPDGAYDYVVRGKMIGGFALVAFPAEYGASGVMTFIVNHDGVVYQKDLGKETGKIAKAMTKFDPDKTWKKVEEQQK